MATHSKTRRAVQRLRRLARRRREAELKKIRQSGTENRAAPPRGSLDADGHRPIGKRLAAGDTAPPTPPLHETTNCALMTMAVVLTSS